MNLQLNDEQLLIQETAKRIARSKILESAAELDRTKDSSLLLDNCKA